INAHFNTSMKGRIGVLGSQERPRWGTVSRPYPGHRPKVSLWALPETYGRSKGQGQETLPQRGDPAPTSDETAAALALGACVSNSLARVRSPSRGQNAQLFHEFGVAQAVDDVRHAAGQVGEVPVCP